MVGWACVGVEGREAKRVLNSSRRQERQRERESGGAGLFNSAAASVPVASFLAYPSMQPC